MENSTFSLVSGASGVLGKEFCSSLAKEGRNLFLTGRNLQKLQDLKSSLLSQNQNIKVVIFAADLSNEEDRQKLFDFADQNAIKFSQFLSVAGVDNQMAFEKQDRQKVLFQLRVNYEAPVRLAQEVLKRRAQNLQMLIVASSCGYLPIPYFALYSSSKGALINFFTAIRYEYEGKGVNITLLSPGSIPTRDDVIEDIKKQGIVGKLSAKSPKFVVKKALKGLAKNKRTVTPGLFNKLVRFFQAILPTGIKCRYAKRHWKDKEKSAF